MGMVLVGAACCIALRERWQRHPFPNYGWWDVAGVIALFALIITFTWWAIRNEKD